jgi:glycosyltransferase involved in cell wall biosynthesis
MNVLFVNHTAILGGGEQSLLDLFEGLPIGVKATLACPAGPLALAAGDLGVPRETIGETDVSVRLGVVRTTRGVIDVARSGLAVQRAARRVRADLVHANSVRAGLMCAAVTRLGGPPVIVHVRDCLPSKPAARATRRAIEAGATLVLANSNYTASCFSTSDALPIRTVYNSVDTSVFDPERIDRRDARSRLGLAVDVVALGLVAQITPWKAQDDAIRITADLRKRGYNARLFMIGETKFARGTETFDNRTFAEFLRSLVTALGIEGSVDFLGHRDDVPSILRALDVLLAPSWEEPFGRSVIEGMSMSVPVIATDVGGPAEIITDGLDGILLPPRQPARWAEVAARLFADEGRRRSMAEAARRTVTERFSPERYVQGVLAAYDEALASR